MHPAHKDERRYSDVLLGVRKKLDALEATLDGKSSVIPVTHSIHVNENLQTASLLNMAIIAENTETFDLPQIQSSVSACEVNQTGMFSLSLTKLLIVFSCENDAKNAVNMDSPLWNVFDDIRLWSEGEFFDDRLVWINCVGIHPLCWSLENLKSIGELWGPVIHVDSKLQGIQKITGARILIRTKAQNKIDNRIKFFYDHGSCDVWVKEEYISCGDVCVNRKDKMYKKNP